MALPWNYLREAVQGMLGVASFFTRLFGDWMSVELGRGAVLCTLSQ